MILDQLHVRQQGAKNKSDFQNILIDDSPTPAWLAGMEALSVQDDKKTSAAQDSSSQGIDAAKKVRNLQKKLKQIQQLKEKVDTTGSNSLTPEQLQKVETEQSVLLELQQLEH